MSQAISVTCTQHSDTQLTWWRVGLRNPRGATSAFKPDKHKCVAAILERMNVSCSFPLLRSQTSCESTRALLCRGGHQTLLFFFFPVWLPDWVSPNMMGFFQMLINHLRNVTRTFREGTETRRKSKCPGGNWNPGEDRRETCLVALTLNFPQESEGERATKGEMGNLMPFSRLRMPHYLRWCELHQSSLLWSSVLDSGDGGDPLQGWGHSRGALLICLLRGACVTKGIISVFH